MSRGTAISVTCIALAAAWVALSCLETEKARFEPNGVLDWAISFGGPGVDHPMDIVALDDGGFLIAGYHGGGEVFDGIEFPEPRGKWDGFLARVGIDHKPLWAVDVYTDDDGPIDVERVEVTFVAATGADDVIACGFTTIGVFSVMEGTGEVVTLEPDPAVYGGDKGFAFLLWFDIETGALSDRRIFAGGEGRVYLRTGAMSNSDGTVLVSGGATGSVTFAPADAPAEFTFPGDGCSLATIGAGLFVAAYEIDSGDLKWAVGGEGCARASKVAALSESEIVVAGLFEETLTLPGLASEPLESAGPDDDKSDAFVAILDAATGSTQKAWRIGGDDGDFGLGVAVAEDGSFTVAGGFHQTIEVCEGGDEPACGTSLTSDTENALFLARYSKVSNEYSLTWARRANASVGNAITPFDMIATADAGLLVGGGFFGEAVFGPDDPNSTAVSTGANTVNADPFIARYDADGRLVWVRDECGDEAFGRVSTLASPAPGAYLVGGSFYGRAIFGQWEPTETELVSTDGEGQTEDVFVAGILDE